jgi:hypothetical protein
LKLNLVTLAQFLEKKVSHYLKEGYWNNLKTKSQFVGVAFPEGLINDKYQKERHEGSKEGKQFPLC